MIAALLFLTLAADAGRPAPRCRGEVCGPGQFCEERFKGHALDEQGRVLKRQQCVPLPAPCVKTPTCACVSRELSVTSCTIDQGQIFTSDWPR